MPKKRSESGRVVVFFQTQPLDVAKSVLEICKEIVTARTPKTDKTPRASKKQEPALALQAPKE
jgi:hypothetical protein